MKNALIISAAALFAGSAALAGNIDFTAVDTNGDNQLTLDEVQAEKPEVTQEDFDAYDADADGFLSEDEFDTWKEEKKRADDMSDSGSMEEPEADDTY
ncbi:MULTISPECIES: calcium-binding protein [Euryhalocaulis]|uniref:calcium-binding protein n=1 Tax=Euryhalocaulis TaxID=1712422 RepID=UPI0003A586D6|nr:MULTISPECIES: calcium-binding protein [Euryhalocaulis]MBA4801388.1 hypothetical protein [Euryhalocaulis sp.]